MPAGAALVTTAAKTGVTVGTGVATFGISAGISIGYALVSRALRPRPPAPPVELVLNPEVIPARWIIGTQRTKGQLIYPGQDLGYFMQGLLLSQGSCESIEEVYIFGKKMQHIRVAPASQTDPEFVINGKLSANDGDQLLPLSGASFLYRNDANDPLIEIYEYFRADGEQGKQLRLFVENGRRRAGYSGAAAGGAYYCIDPNTGEGYWTNDPDPECVTELVGTGSGPGRIPAGQITNIHVREDRLPPWTADHKVNGKSWFMVRSHQPVVSLEDLTDDDETNDRVFDHLPEVELVVKGLKITYPDPDPDMPEDARVTKHTNNAAAVRWWWLTERRGAPESMIDIPSFRAAFAWCEETITVDLPPAYAGYKNTSKRYTIDGIIESGEDVESIEIAMDMAWQGFVVEAGGKLYFKPGVPETKKPIVTTIRDSDIMEVISISPAPPLQERVNAIDATLRQSARHDYRELQLPQYVDGPQLAKDNNQKRSLRIEHKFTRNPITGGRLNAIHSRRLRERKSLTVRVKPGDDYHRHGVLPTDHCNFQHAEAGYADVTRMQIDRVLVDKDESVILDLRIVNPGTYADTLVVPPLRDEPLFFPGNVPAPDVVNLAAKDIVALAQDGTTNTNVRVSWDEAFVEATIVFVNGRQVRTVRTTSCEIPLTTGEQYTIGARHVTKQGRVGNLAEITHTPGGDTEAPGDITNVELLGLPAGLDINWQNPTDPDLDRVRIFASKDNNPPLDSELVVAIASDRFELLGLEESTEYHVQLQPVDYSGNAGNKTDVVSAQTLSVVASDTRTPNDMIVRPVPIGANAEGYLFEVFVTPRDQVARQAIDFVELQVGRSAEGFTVADGILATHRLKTYNGNVVDVINVQVPSFGEWFFSARAHNPNAAGDSYGPWNTPVPALTTDRPGDTGVPSAPGLVIGRGKSVEAKLLAEIIRPTTNWKTGWEYTIQIAETQLPNNQSTATGIREFVRTGTGQIQEGTRIFTVPNAGWTPNEWVGRVLYLYRNFGTDFTRGSVGNPYGETIISNTADTITVTGDPYRLPRDASLPINAADRTFNYGISRHTTGAWLRSITVRAAVLGSDGWTVPPRTVAQLLEEGAGYARVKLLNKYGLGVWSPWVQFTAQDLSALVKGAVLELKGEFKGDKGAKGVQGGQGPPGASGAQGDPGEKGFPGDQGAPGPAGAVGSPGLKGFPGAQGPPGSPGAVGNPGSDGDQTFVYYTNAPEDTPASQLVPLVRLADGRWTTESGYYWWGDATQVPD